MNMKNIIIVSIVCLSFIFPIYNVGDIVSTSDQNVTLSVCDQTSEYSIGEVFKLEPYNKLEGAGANHVYTRYEISLFSVSLEFKGFGRLARLDKAMEHNWFTFEEVAHAQKGVKQAFIDAWQEHHDIARIR